MRGILRGLLIYLGVLLALSSLGALLKITVTGGKAGFQYEGQPTSWHLWGSYVFYLDRGDRAVVYVRLPENISWSLAVRFTRVSDNRTWGYSSRGTVAEPTPVEFIAPRRGIYVVIVEAFSQGRRIIAYTSAGVRDSGKYGAAGVLTYLAVMGGMLAALGFLVGDSGPGRLETLSWEIKGMMRHALMLIMVFILSYAYTSFGPLMEFLDMRPKVSIDNVEVPKAYLLFAERANTLPPYDIFTVFFIYAVIIVVSLYPYEDERGLIRDALATGMGRVELFLAKLGAAFLLALAPMLSAHLLLGTLSDPWLLASQPRLTVWLYLRRLIWDSWFILAFIAPALAFSTVFRKSLYALISALLTPYLLEMAGKADWLRLRTLFYFYNSYMVTDRLIVPKLWFFVTLALASMALGLVAWTYRDNA